MVTIKEEIYNIYSGCSIRTFLLKYIIIIYRIYKNKQLTVPRIAIFYSPSDSDFFMIFFLLFLETQIETTVIGPCEDPCGEVFERIRATRKNQDMQISTYFSKFKHNLDPGETYAGTAAPESIIINRRGIFKLIFRTFPSEDPLILNVRNVQKVTNITTIFTKFTSKIFSKCVYNQQKPIFIELCIHLTLFYNIISIFIQLYNIITLHCYTIFSLIFLQFSKVTFRNIRQHTQFLKLLFNDYFYTSAKHDSIRFNDKHHIFNIFINALLRLFKFSDLQCLLTNILLLQFHSGSALYNYLAKYYNVYKASNNPINDEGPGGQQGQDSSNQEQNHDQNYSEDSSSYSNYSDTSQNNDNNQRQYSSHGGGNDDGDGDDNNNHNRSPNNTLFYYFQNIDNEEEEDEDDEWTTTQWT